jgi:8-oxo-dGTP pyrophosphatase MutT (NUDIX family)
MQASSPAMIVASTSWGCTLLRSLNRCEKSILQMMYDSRRGKAVCMESIAEKVTAFVTWVSPEGVELLLFEHPRAGIQLPAGTVEADEPHATAAAREAREETGLADLPRAR